MMWILKSPLRCAGVALSLVAAGASAFACGGDDAGQPATPDDGGGGGDGDIKPPGPLATKLTRASHGSAMDISEDDAILVTANHDVGTISVFDVVIEAGKPATVTRKAEVAVCAEPTQVVLAPSGDRAFVVCRKDQKVVRVDTLRTTPVKGPEVAVGSEPTSIALTPKGTAAWVANWSDGTTTQLDTEKMAVTSTVDLNDALAKSGVLGTVSGRPGLAHPRSVAITNNTDELENDESVFVTEFFAQQKEALAANGANADVARQGFVYRINLKDKAVSMVPLPPIADMGIHDHADGVAGCYPNQLQSINVQGSFAYVVSICASPKGPLGDFTGPAFATCADDNACPGKVPGSCTIATSLCKTNCTTNAQCGLGGVCDTTNICKSNLWDAKSLQTSAVSVIDIGANKVVASVAMNSELDKLFAEKKVPDTSARRMPLSVTDIAFVPGTLNAYLPAKGTDAVFRLDFNATYDTKALDAVGFADRQFIPLDVGTLDASKQGKLPIAMTIAHGAKVGAASRFGFVLNDASRNVTAIDLKVDNIAGLPDQASVATATAMPTAPEQQAVLEGRRLFSTGLGRWSLNGQGWGACETCHWDGLSDQVTWFHLRGARQSPSIDQTVNKKNPAIHRVMNWQANVDELEDHEAGALRTVLGGVGADVKSFDLTFDARIAFDKFGQAGLNGSMAAAVDPASPSTLVGEVCVIDDWKKLDAYEKTIRSPRKPSNLDKAKVAAGLTAFQEGKCAGCHGGDMWTISHVFYTPDPNVASPTNVNAALKSTSWTAAVNTAGFPAALLPTAIVANQTMRYSGANPAALDQLTCFLRPVGTFNVAETGVGVAELKRNMTAVAQGDELTGKGYNVPSLLGIAANAPYFHAGNARTLEGVLSSAFADHHGALNPAFLADAGTAAAKREALVQFLLSIDQDTAPIPLPALGSEGGDFCDAP
ncbi:MAG TPA: hypothetical protein VLT33_29825 [Labilithrix sp.]|nr:hypothetical protein [Labilithrix sp.]